MIRRNRTLRHSIFPRFLTIRCFTSAGRVASAARLTPPVPIPTEDRPPRSQWQIGRARKDRRRRIDPTTFEKQYTPDEMEFMNAMQRFKEASGKSFPTHAEVIRIAIGIGYRLGIDEPDSAAEEPVDAPYAAESSTVITVA